MIIFLMHHLFACPATCLVKDLPPPLAPSCFQQYSLLCTVLACRQPSHLHGDAPCPHTLGPQCTNSSHSARRAIYGAIAAARLRWVVDACMHASQQPPTHQPCSPHRLLSILHTLLPLCGQVMSQWVVFRELRAAHFR